MILTTLNDYYHRLSEEGRVPEPGFSWEKISYALVFSVNGTPIAIDDIRDLSGKKPKPSIRIVPYDKGRTSNIHAYPLWDKTSYAFGVTADNDKKSAASQNNEFKKRQRLLFDFSEEPEIQSFLMLVESWQSEMLPELPGFDDEMLDRNFVFRLDGEKHYVHELPEARRRWRQFIHAQQDNTETRVGPCLVTGEQHAQLGDKHPSIRNISGAKNNPVLVSYNVNAYESYGRKKHANASISRQAIFGYTTALNYLLRKDNDNRQRLVIGDATVVFWAQATDTKQAQDAEQFFFEILNEPPTDQQEAARLKTVLDRVADGTALAETELGLDGNTRFYVLGLAPNAARLSVRFWCVDTLQQITRYLAEHQRDMALEPWPLGKALPPIRRLPLAVVPERDGKSKFEDIPPHLAGEITRSVLTGQRYPQSLLTNLIMRLRSSGMGFLKNGRITDATGLRFVLCKAVLSRNARLAAHTAPFSQEEISVSLDPKSTHPGYLLGRLFAELEQAQKRAIPNTNATISDRYYGAASATPASVFPLLLRNVKNHLAKLRKGGNKEQAAAHAISRNIEEIVGGLDERLPKSLKIEDQGRFAIGYYHQTQARFAKQRDTDKDEKITEGDSE